MVKVLRRKKTTPKQNFKKKIKNNRIFIFMFIMFGFAIVSYLLVQKQLNFRQNASFDPITRTFSETFNGSPSSPQTFSSSDWQIYSNLADMYRWKAGPDPMNAQHGTDCSAPPATHTISGWDQIVFNCRDHIMTSINGNDSYAAVYLSPNAILDWSNGPATLSWDVSTVQMSARDWIDVWITEPNDFMALPGEDFFPAYQGAPKNSISARFNFTVGANAWAVGARSNGQSVGSGQLYTSITPSATVRSPFQLIISQNSITIKSVSTNEQTTFPVNLGFTKGMVQLGQHSYNPLKDGAGTPATWHWDNVKMTPAIPFSYIKVSPQKTFQDWNDTQNGKITTLTFTEAAPSNARLVFAATCKVSMNFGSGWINPTYQPGSKSNHMAETASSFVIDVPQGKSSVQVKFAGDDWYAGYPCALENPVIQVMDSTFVPQPTTVVTSTPAPTIQINTPTPVLPSSTPTPIVSDTTPPSVSITSPLNGSILPQRSRIPISAAASDNIGISRVVFYIDGVIVKTDRSAPYSYSWYIVNVATGPHTIKAVARDTSGNTASTQISVTK